MIKVFLVEDEIVTREGMRDMIDWRALGCELVGDAADGELALPLIRERRPDVIITDIKMPFMDGLELTHLVKAMAPETKVVILSGHDEFQFAQQAIALGVTEYLLKPVSLQDLERTLRKLAALVDAERQNRAQAQDSLSLQRDKFLAQLAAGGFAPAEAIEKARHLELDLAAPFYQAVVLQARGRCAAPFSSAGLPGAHLKFADFQFLEALVARLAQAAERLIWFRKDVDEFVLLLQGADAGALARQAIWIGELARAEARQNGHCELAVGAGPACERLVDIAASYDAAARQANGDMLPASIGTPASGGTPASADLPAAAVNLLQINRKAVDGFLRQGTPGAFDAFWAALAAPLRVPLASSSDSPADRAALNYLLIDLVLASAGFVGELGGDPAEAIPQALRLQALLPEIHTMDQAQALARHALLAALDFRDRRAARPHAGALQRAREFIQQHSTDPDLSLNDVAGAVHMSPSHFSVVFKRETGEAFSEYLTRIRIEQAKDLLRLTALRIHEIAERVGYGDPHYFSAAFKRATGLTPREYKGQSGE